jgi:hypothetical protein
MEESWEETYRREVAEAKQFLLDEHGISECWDTDEVQQVFEITGFMSPACFAVKRDTGEKGTPLFGNLPGRVYYGWKPSIRGGE